MYSKGLGRSPILNVAEDPASHTTNPIVTGTTILAIKYDGGVLMACDTVAYYGSMMRFTDVQRISKVANTLVGGDGEYSDFQYIHKFLKQMETELECRDQIEYSPDEIFHRLTTVLYERRTKMNPLWNNLVVCGVDPNTKKPFIGCTDNLGTPFSADFVATGFGLHLAQPIMAERYRPGLSYQQAKDILVDCLKVCYYRDARAGNRIIFARAELGRPVQIDSKPALILGKWDYTLFAQSTWDQ